MNQEPSPIKPGSPGTPDFNELYLGNPDLIDPVGSTPASRAEAFLGDPLPGSPEEDVVRAEQSARRRRRGIMWSARVVVFVIIFGGWQLFTSKSTGPIVDPFFFGHPTGILSTLKDWFEHGTQFGSIWTQIWATLKEAALGFLLGTCAGTIFGVALGQFRFLSDVLNPYIKVVNAIPRIILAAIFQVAFGIATESKVITAAVLVFFGVFFNAYQGTREVDRNLLNNALVLGANRWEINRHVVLPSAATWIIASLHVAFGFAIIGAVVSEILGATQGLGLLIYSAMGSAQINGVFAGMALIAVIALIAELLISMLEKRVLGWRPPSQSQASGI
jgi:NitT/TauT family transport system permease protein